MEQPEETKQELQIFTVSAEDLLDDLKNGLWDNDHEALMNQWRDGIVTEFTYY